jgi:hypothetical protein
MIPEVFDVLECNELYEQRFFDTLHMIEDHEEPVLTKVPAFSITAPAITPKRGRKVVTRNYSYPYDKDPLVMEASGFEFSQLC